MFKQIAACVLALVCAGCAGWLEPGVDPPTIVTPSYAPATAPMAQTSPALPASPNSTVGDTTVGAATVGAATVCAATGHAGSLISDHEIFACVSGDRMEAHYSPDHGAVHIIVAGRSSAALSRVRAEGYLDYVTGQVEFKRAGVLAVFIEAQDDVVVRRGDSLSLIARRIYGDMARAEDIARANANTIADPDRIRIGQSLRLPRQEQRCRRVLA